MLAAFLLGSVLALAHSPAGAPSESSGAASIVVGAQRLYRCKIGIEGYCGRLQVPLNWLNSSDGTISVLYQWIPALNGISNQTIVAESGGPGYTTTGFGYVYRLLFSPLLTDHNLLLMDQRGTGGSAAIDCQALQLYGATVHPTMPLVKAAALCGAQLNHTYLDARGDFVHASDLFGTSQSVRDLAAILAALKQDRVDRGGPKIPPAYWNTVAESSCASQGGRWVDTWTSDAGNKFFCSHKTDRNSYDYIVLGFEDSNLICEISFHLPAEAVPPTTMITTLGFGATGDTYSTGVRIDGSRCYWIPVG